MEEPQAGGDLARSSSSVRTRRPASPSTRRRPGIVIGKKGADIEKLRKKVADDDRLGGRPINIVEVRKPEIDATLVAQSIAQQLERRVAFRRAMKRAVQTAMRLGAEGISISCAGRLGGASNT